MGAAVVEDQVEVEILFGGRLIDLAPGRLLDMVSTKERHLQRMLKVIEAARKGRVSLVSVADSLDFLLARLEDVHGSWAEQFGSHILTLESAGLASPEQQREMGEGFAALQTQTPDALEAMVKTLREGQ